MKNIRGRITLLLGVLICGLAAGPAQGDEMEPSVKSGRNARLGLPIGVVIPAFTGVSGSLARFSYGLDFTYDFDYYFAGGVYFNNASATVETSLAATVPSSIATFGLQVQMFPLRFMFGSLYLGLRLGASETKVTVSSQTVRFQPMHWGANIGYFFMMDTFWSIGFEAGMMSLFSVSVDSPVAATSIGFSMTQFSAAARVHF